MSIDKYQFKHLGQDYLHYKKTLTSPEELEKRAFESLLICGKLPSKIDKKRVPQKYIGLLTSKGYVKDIPNISILITTGKVYSEENSNEGTN